MATRIPSNKHGIQSHPTLELRPLDCFIQMVEPLSLSLAFPPPKKKTHINFLVPWGRGVCVHKQHQSHELSSMSQLG